MFLTSEGTVCKSATRKCRLSPPEEEIPEVTGRQGPSRIRIRTGSRLSGFQRILTPNCCTSCRRGRPPGPAVSSVKEHAMTEILSQRRLGRMRDGQFTPNVACVCWSLRRSGIEVPRCRVRFHGWMAKSKRLARRSQHSGRNISIEVPIPRLIAGTAAASIHGCRSSPGGNDGKFYTAPEYPRGAWYEAIVNACVHRSYGLPET